VNRKRYAIVGTGGRAVLYTDAIAGQFKDSAQLVAMCDLSPTRMTWHNRHLQDELKSAPIPTFTADAFEQMVRQAHPETVIVCTRDDTHDEYIIRAMQLGCDVICEKPMTINAAKARAILDAVKRTGRKLRITFNYRYAPLVTKVKQLLQEGSIGRPTAVDFSWVLDTSHGADYFRRWHREKDKSGGLLVHKASHHFDLVNWWLDSWPHIVFAMGDLKFYGRRNAEGRGETERTTYTRYTGNEQARADPFSLFLDDRSYGGAALKQLYLDAERDSGYLRDRNVFGDTPQMPITIEDTMAITARFRSGVILSYSLLAYSPWEGFRVAITGTKGRLEIYDKHGSHIIAGQSDADLAAAQTKGAEQSLRLFPMFHPPQEIEVPSGEGGHGGADPRMLQDIFAPGSAPDPFGRAASHEDGAAAVALGIAANESIRTGLPVMVNELIPLPATKPPSAVLM
jgi:predicted dehydrogenase